MSYDGPSSVLPPTCLFCHCCSWGQSSHKVEPKKDFNLKVTVVLCLLFLRVFPLFGVLLFTPYLSI
jgi:hypothetical protein